MQKGEIRMYRRRIDKIGLAANGSLHRGDEMLEYLKICRAWNSVDNLEIAESEDENG